MNASRLKTRSDALTPEACRRARQLLGWTPLYLASEALCTELTVQRFEQGRSRSHISSLTGLRAALERGGVTFSEGVDGAMEAHFRRALPAAAQAD